MLVIVGTIKSQSSTKVQGCQWISGQRPVHAQWMHFSLAMKMVQVRVRPGVLPSLFPGVLTILNSARLLYVFA